MESAVLGAAEREGLTLVRAENATGFRGVYHTEASSKPRCGVTGSSSTSASTPPPRRQFLLEMSDDKIETLLTEAGMAKVGHRKRFVSCVRKLRAAAA